MNGRRDRSRLLPDVPLVKVTGRILGAEVEDHPNPGEIDHLWIRIQAGEEIFLSVNTSSKRNRIAGFDPRIRVGLIRGNWVHMPPYGVEIVASNSYAELESRSNVFFEHKEREELEEMLMDRCRRACLLEVWGAPYRHRIQGIHQIHSRRASCAVAEDLIGRDGALKFYYESEQATEHFLFKFCGQP